MTNPKKIIALILGRELKSVDHLDKNKKIRVSFTGGLGAQLISAAIYYDLSAKGYLIEADLSYFEKNSRFIWLFTGIGSWVNMVFIQVHFTLLDLQVVSL